MRQSTLWRLSQQGPERKPVQCSGEGATIRGEAQQAGHTQDELLIQSWWSVKEKNIHKHPLNSIHCILDTLPSDLYHCLIHQRIPIMLAEEPVCNVRRKVSGTFQAEVRAGIKPQRQERGGETDMSCTWGSSGRSPDLTGKHSGILQARDCR